MQHSGQPRPGFWLAGRFSPRQVDWVVVCVAALLSLPAAVKGAIAGGPSGWLALATVLPGTLPLRWRREHPGPVLALLAVSFAVYAIVARNEVGGVWLVFGVYAAALYGTRPVRIAAGLLAVVLFGLGFGTLLSTSGERVVRFGHLDALAFLSGVAWVAGDRTRTRRAYLAELEERARRLERERDEKARRATEDERSRIARELHDVVAHSVSVIAVQAGAARRTAGAHPERSVEVLETIERTARSALGELRSLLGVLRRGGEPVSAREPQPTLAELDKLMAETRSAGLGVELRVEGGVRPLDALLDLCAYRLIQEALTNVLKHAPGARAHVLVQYGDHDLSITVVDDGTGIGHAAGAGHGLIGMRERVELVGGRMHAGPHHPRGFRVHAELPYAAAGRQAAMASSFGSLESSTES